MWVTLINRLSTVFSRHFKECFVANVSDRRNNIEVSTYPNGVLQRFRLLTKAIELVHGVWLKTREAYEHPLVKPRYWDVERERMTGLTPLDERAQNIISTMMTDGWFLSAQSLLAGGSWSRDRCHAVDSLSGTLRPFPNSPTPCKNGRRSGTE